MTGVMVEQLVSDVEGVLTGAMGAENNIAADWMATSDDEGHGRGIPDSWRGKERGKPFK